MKMYCYNETLILYVEQYAYDAEETIPKLAHDLLKNVLISLPQLCHFEPIRSRIFTVRSMFCELELIFTLLLGRKSGASRRVIFCGLFIFGRHLYLNVQLSFAKTSAYSHHFKFLSTAFPDGLRCQRSL